MTQIAAQVASIGGKHGHAGKAHSAKGDAGVDFAAVVAGLGLSGEEDGAAAPDGDALTLAAGDTEAGTGTGTGEGKAGEPVILDLALGAAAQSAVADMVVAAQPVVVNANQPGAPKTEDAIALDGRAAGRPGWRMLADAATTGQVGTGAGAATAVETDATAESIPVAAPAATATEAKPPRVSKDKGADSISSGKVATAAVAPAALAKGATNGIAAATSDETAPAQAAIEQPAVPVAPEGTKEDKAVQPRAVKTGVQTGAAFRQAAREAAQPAAPAVATDQPAQPMVAAMLAARDPKQPVAATAIIQTGVQIAAEEAGDPAPTLAAEAVVTEGAPPKTTAATGRPVMSALHRAAAQASGEKVDGPATPIVTTGRDAETGKDQGSGQDSAASAASTGDTQASIASDGVASSGGQFSDILQSLPPIAQSRLATVGDVSPVVTGPTDVGATLQGQVIDMGVDGQWIDRMAKEITALAEGTGHSRFQLNPPNLGRIQIDVWQGENGGQVKLMTETDEAARRLNDGKSDLQADARLSALSLNSITIERASAGFDGGQDPNPQQNSQQNPQRHPQGSDQGGSQTSTQTGGQGENRGNQGGAQANSAANSQSGNQGQQNSNGQGKSSWNRDVLNERAGTMAQDGSSVRRDGDRLIRYA